MAKSLDELKKELEQLKKELKNLTGEVPVKFDTSSVEDVEKSIKAINSLIKDAKEETKSLSDQFKSSYERLRGITSEMKGQVTSTGKIRNAFRQVERSQQDLLLHSQGISILSDKELVNINKKLKKQIEITKQEGERLSIEKNAGKKISNIQDKLKNDEEFKNLKKDEQLDYIFQEINLINDLNDEQRAILASYVEQTIEIEGHKSAFGEILDQSGEELKLRDKANKKLGVTGALLKGIAKIPVLGNLIDAQEALTEAQEESRKEASTTESVMSAAFSSLGDSLKESLSDPLTRLTLSFTILSKLIKTIVKLAVDFDNRTVEISRNLGMSYESAHKLNKEFMSIAFNSGEVLATSTNLKEAYLNINNSLGTNAQLTDKQLIDQTKILNLTGLTAEEAATIAEYSVLTGQSQEDIFDNVMAINTGVISNQKVLQETLTVNGQLAAFYRNQPQLIAQAVAQSQRLGLSLEDTKDISRGLLDFQSSIEAEMQAELMTGKQLNLEQARYLALQGDTAGAAKLMLQQVGGIHKFNKLNVLQQESLAKAMGMSTDQLANSLVRQEKLSKLTPQQREEEAELFKMRETAAKRLENATKKIQDSFSRVFAGPVGTMINLFAGILEKIAASPLGSMIAGGVGVAAIGASLVGMARVFGRATLLGALPVMDIFKGVGGSGGGTGGGGVFDSLTGGKGTKGRRRMIKTLGNNKLTKTIAKNSRLLKGAGITSVIGGVLSAIPTLMDEKLDIGDKILKIVDENKGLIIGAVLAPFTGGASLAVGGIADAFLPTIGNYDTAPKLATGGIVVKETKAIIGEAGPEAVLPLNDFYKKMDDMISAINGIKGDIYVDGNRLNTAVAMNTSKFGA